MCGRNEEYVFEEETYRGFTIKLIQDSHPMNPRNEFDHLGTFLLWSRDSMNPDSEVYRTNTNSKEEFVEWLASMEVEWGDKKENGRYEYNWHWTSGDHFKWKGRWYPLAKLEGKQWEEIRKEYVILGVHERQSGYSVDTEPERLNNYGDYACDGFIYVEKAKLLKETGYTKDELFSKDPRRKPRRGEHIKVKGYKELCEFLGWRKGGSEAQVRTKIGYTDEHRNYWSVPVDDIESVMCNQAERMLEDEVREYSNWAEGRVCGYVIEPEFVGKNQIDSCWGFYPDEDDMFTYAMSQAKESVDHYIDSLLDETFKGTRVWSVIGGENG
jgi:hypothetical protein